MRNEKECLQIFIKDVSKKTSKHVLTNLIEDDFFNPLGRFASTYVSSEYVL